MAHFARINDSNVVVEIIVIDNSLESIAADYLKNLMGGTWLQTSYNTKNNQHVLGGTPFRKNYAGLGFTYDAELDAFIPPKPWPSWQLDLETFDWVAPVSVPVTDPGPGQIWAWDEIQQQFIGMNPNELNGN